MTRKPRKHAKRPDKWLRTKRRRRFGMWRPLPTLRELRGA